MKVTLKDYQPIGSEILLKPQVKTHSEGGLMLGKEKTDRWLEVTKIGGVVPEDIFKPGDFVIFDAIQTPQMHLEFGGERYLQINMHNVKGIVAGKAVLSENVNVT